MPLKDKLSEAEIQALNECSLEAFYKRSIPFMVIGGGGTYLAVSSGILSPNSRWGATPKVLLACTIAYFLGQMSYEPICRQKLMNVPDSKIGEMIKKHEYGIPKLSCNESYLKVEDRLHYYQPLAV